MAPLTRYVPIAPAPTRRPDTVPALQYPSESPTQSAISHFQNNTTSETRHHVDPDLSVLYAQHSTEYQVPLFEQHVYHTQQSPSTPHHHAIAAQSPRLRTSTQYGINIPTQLPPAPRTTSRHTPRSPDKHTFAVPRVPPPKTSPPTDTSSGISTDLLDNYIKMLNNTPNTADAVAPVSPAMTQDLNKFFEMLQGGTYTISIASQIDCNTATIASPSTSHPGNPTPHSTPFDTDYRTLEEIITSPEFTSPLFEDTPNLSDASPFTPSSSSTRHQISPALFDYADSSSGGIPLFGPSPIVLDSNQALGTPNLDSLHLQSGGLGFQNLDSLLSMPNGSPVSPSADTRDLFSPSTSPLFSDSSSVRPEGVRSVSDPVKKAQPTGHRKNLAPEQLLGVEAPTQQRNYFGPSATSRKPVPAGFRRAPGQDCRQAPTRAGQRGRGAVGRRYPERCCRGQATSQYCRCSTKPAT
ncbi:hypothetical protein RSOLAG1IB_08568 [Rhizoctonia solani AG-1 IB]|uniref:Uncharacterized protein n=1 Tax=Thanatephorus cucumeris (strain AG1-IB / isolate 7/3/14) TaxID=1108050 RepID=A0A0B7FQI9_THACB|nr:hypothetical protein RSOLAG1IB_08568 [Rhizoctonia solani AG-1 IB]